MSISPATATARRNLLQRIDRFMARSSAPTADHLANLDQALAGLELGNYPAGEDAMMLAEHGWPARQAAGDQPRTREDLIAILKRLRSV